MKLASTSLWDDMDIMVRASTANLFFCLLMVCSLASTRLRGRPHLRIWIAPRSRPNLHTTVCAVVDEGSERWTESHCEVESARCMRQVIGGGGAHVLHLLVVDLILYLQLRPP